MRASCKNQINYFLKNPSYLFSELGHKQTEIFILSEKFLPTFLKIFKEIRKRWYSGKGYICPCCGGNYRKFLPVGTKFRRSAQCPGCYSLERHRLLVLYLKNRTNLFSEKLRILHISPNKILQYIFKNLSNLDYISIDISSPMAMIKMNIEKLEFEENFFDAIICLHVLEHVHDDKKALKELYRVLKPSGWAIIQTPIDYTRETTFENKNIKSKNERKKYFGEVDHLRIYGIDYKERLLKAGFNVKIDNYIDDLTLNSINKFGLNKKERIYFCSK